MTDLINIFSPAAYLVAREGERLGPVPANKAFAYVLAGDGLFKMARSRHLTAMVRVTTWRQPLPGLQLMDHPTLGRWPMLPASLLDACLDHARRVAWARPVEQLYQFFIRGKRVHVHRPEQAGSAGQILYSAMEIDPADVILDLHSHHNMAASFSGTDDRDETGFQVYGVIGRIHTRPEVRFRVGVYGDFAPIPASQVFHGTINLLDRFYDRRGERLS